jgi:NAD(P)-dependent dehydrogenase (short-subunit alcohol dehydrogenase family)/selenocysteine lyase/cysteine desulfurase
VKVDDPRRWPEVLAPHYSRFRVSERLLLTGHSHQAWPDVGFAAQQRAWLDAAELVDDKWGRAFARAERVASGFAALLDDRDGDIALGANTHELVVRFLSALPLTERPRIVTTDAEFYTLRRQLARLAEEGLAVHRVAAEPLSTLPERLAAAVDDRTAAVAVSCVFFESARIVRGLREVQDACAREGAHLLVDAYHALGVVPFSLVDEGLEQAFVVGGGYKYCQLGEGNCFLRTPPGCDLRPVVTGWFSDFDSLGDDLSEGGEIRVRYGSGAARFAGATYDPTSHYRAAAVFDFFVEQGMTPEALRRVSQHQVGLLATAFDALDLDPEIIARDRAVDLRDIGGFLVLRAARAGEITRRLRQRGVFTDYRGATLRLGPAPYLVDGQLDAAVGLLGEVVRELSMTSPRVSTSAAPRAEARSARASAGVARERAPAELDADGPSPGRGALQGRSAVVTGGGRGIGAATALALASAGARVTVAARTPAEVEAVADRLRAAGHEAVALRGDVTDPDDVRELFLAAEREMGPVDILVNNAGAATSNPLSRTTFEEWSRLMAVNAGGPFLCTRAVIGGMLERDWGRVINVASTAGLEGAPYISAYVASKHAVVGLTRALAREVAGTGVTVNAVCPGWVDTPLTDAAVHSIVEKTGKTEEDALATILEAAGQTRLLESAEIASRILALCAGGDETNGQALRIDGDAINPKGLVQ